MHTSRPSIHPVGTQLRDWRQRRRWSQLDLALEAGVSARHLSFMETGRAVHRLTGELADFAGIDAGYIRVGDRADLVVVNPAGLTDELDEVSEAPMEGLGLTRLVKRNDAAVDATLINGRVAYRRDSGFAQALGKERGFGRFLPGRDVLSRPQEVSSGAPAYGG